MKTLLAALLVTLSGYAAMPEALRIDELLAKGWEKAGVQGNPAAADEVFVRRIYLDVIGRIPTIVETSAFMDSKELNKRMALIDKLLSSEGFVSHSFNYWADVLRLQTDVKGAVAGYAYAEWLKSALRKNQPFDAMVRELVTADGGIWDSGAVGFYLRDAGMPLDHLATTVQAFLGTSIVCAQCHNHPFDKWTQMDYYHMASFTYGMNSKGYGDLGFKNKGAMDGGKKKDMREQRSQLKVVAQSMQEMMKPLRYTTISEYEQSPKLPHDYQYKDAAPHDLVAPAVMFGQQPEMKPGAPRTDGFAQWMTSSENPRFTTVIANRLWKRAMGMALIEPLDEMTDSSVPANAPLMSYLEELVKQKKYDMKEVLRVIYNSAAYQRAATTKEVEAGDVYHFTGPLLRRMSAEQTWDSLVTLMSGEPDATLGAQSEVLAQRLDSLEKLYDTLATLTPEKALTHLDEIKAERGEIDARNEDLRKKLDAAKAAKDMDEVKRISKILTNSREEVARETGRIIFGAETFDELRDGVRKGKIDNSKKPQSGGKKALMAAVPREELEKIRNSGLTQQQMRKKLNELKAKMQAMRRVMVDMPELKRASELPSPAPRGHLARLFGQSDRETIENASDDATVPQALALLNGDAAAAVGSPASAFRKQMEGAADPMARMDAIYLGLLSRRPTAEERVTLTQIVAERKDMATDDVLHALLNTSQFLFVQ
jgi:hypothetical protein